MRKLSHCDNVIYSMSCLFSTVVFDFDNENTSSSVLTWKTYSVNVQAVKLKSQRKHKN